MALANRLPIHLADDFFKNVLKYFPPQCAYCFGYGSAVFPQQGQKPGKMVDLVFVVDDPVSWHRQNLEINFKHYSGIRWLGPKLLAAVQENMASGIFYNPFVELEDRLVKYGVISTKAFRDDLLNWSHFYIAGRMHKPVRNLQSPKKDLATCIEKNRIAALRLALIHLPEVTSKFDLYVAITKLSYTGDFRMYVGEHPHKAENIVKPLIGEFDKIYDPILEGLKPGVKADVNGEIQNPADENAIFSHMMKLPYPVQWSLVTKAGRPPKYYCVEDTMADLAQTEPIKSMLNKEISRIVFASSIRQTIQGIFTAGVIKSIRYGLEKIMKKLTAKNDQKQV